MELKEGKRIFKNVQEAEEYLEKTYKNKFVQFFFWHKKKQCMESRTEKVDRIAIDIVKRPVQVVLFLCDTTCFRFDKDDFFNEVKLIN